MCGNADWFMGVRIDVGYLDPAPTEQFIIKALPVNALFDQERYSLQFLEPGGWRESNQNQVLSKRGIVVDESLAGGTSPKCW